MMTFINVPDVYLISFIFTIIYLCECNGNGEEQLIAYYHIKSEVILSIMSLQETMCYKLN